MNKEQYFNKHLPKWCQMLVWGEPVTHEQAMEIIIRTDSFFEYASGNNQKFNESLKNKIGFVDWFDFEKQYPDREFKFDKYNEYMKFEEEFRNSIKYINTEFVNNSWISCCFIGGVHGWCHPTGEIGYVDNIGKYPSVEEVYNEWVLLSKEFPFLNLYVTLMSGEGCEDERHPVVTMKVENGIVTFIEAILPENPPRRRNNSNGNDIDIVSLISGRGQRVENYFTEDYIVEWFNKIKDKYKQD